MLKKKKMLTFDLDNEKITKQEYENRLSILEFQYTQDLAEIERLREKSLLKCTKPMVRLWITLILIRESLKIVLLDFYNTWI